MTGLTPPDLPGYDYQRELGQGGFADVHLYRQRLPSREVAVKVLRQTATSSEDRERFENEANRMAMLSSHPGIVTIYEVGVSPDDRPYLTMEYCPHDHFGRIAREQPLTVARALEVGVKIAAAVETAHRAAILHRDVKPANILLTTYGEPALTDFGIAGGAGSEGLAVSQGVSIPFAAPEVLDGSTVGDELADVYSLGATVYALLAGRSPFSTGGPLSEAELLQRVLNAALAPTGRADVPASLERVLATTLARSPANRFESAAAFGRALQGVEAELGLAQTPLRVADTAPPAATSRTSGDEDDDSTRFKAVQRVDPDGPASAPIAGIPSTIPGAAPQAPTPAADWSVDAPRPADHQGLGDRTIRRQSRDTAAGAGAADAEVDAEVPSAGWLSDGRRRTILSVAGAAVVVLVVVFVLSRSGGEAADERGPTSTTADESPLVVGGAPPRPVDVSIEVLDDGGHLVTWAADAAEGDTFQVFFTEGPSDLADETVMVDDPELEVSTDRRFCVTVETIRAGRVSDASTEVCTP